MHVRFGEKTSETNGPRPDWRACLTLPYIKVQNQWGYLSLITDAYSRKIMGIGFRSDLSALGCLAALQMAYDNRSYGRYALIHHSDRGSQYCCEEYVRLLKSKHVGISMTEKHDPYENALAERINGIIKGEFNLYSSQENFEQTYERIVRSITTYNEIRPHSSCDYLTPCQAHQKEGELKKRWKKYPKKMFKKQMPESIEEAGRLPPRSKPQPLLYGQQNKEVSLNKGHV